MNKHFAWAGLGVAGALMACGGGGTTSTGAGGGATSTATSAGGGGPGAVCSDCVGMKDVFKAGSACEKSLMDCNANVDCDSWFKCVQNCNMSSFNKACFDSCDQSAAVVANLYQPVYTCTCTACKTECAPACQ